MHQTPANHVGIFDAKTHLSELIERVRGGESFVLTKHGMPVARLVPAGEDPGAVASEWLKCMRAIGQQAAAEGHPITPEEITGWINEGRR